jgi:hypothetical protein
VCTWKSLSHTCTPKSLLSGDGAFGVRSHRACSSVPPAKLGYRNTLLPSDLTFQAPVHWPRPREPKARRCPAPANRSQYIESRAAALRPTRTFVFLLACPVAAPGEGEPWRRPLCTSTRPLTKCRHPFLCSIITALSDQAQPYINLDRARRRPPGDIGVQKLRQDSDVFRKPPTTCVRPVFISHPSTTSLVSSAFIFDPTSPPHLPRVRARGAQVGGNEWTSVKVLI